MIVSLFMHKGGVGKTSIATTLAAGCAQAGLTTILVEADGQGTASHYAGVPPRDLFYTWIQQGLAAVDVVPVPTTFHGSGELYILSASKRQSKIETDPQAPTIIYERLRELNTYADVVIVDTSPGRTHIHAGVLYGADYLLIPTTCDAFSRESLAAVMEDYRSAAQVGERANYPIAKILGIAPNRFVAREDNQQANYTYLNEVYGDRLTVFPFIVELAVWRQATEWNESIYQLRHEPGVTDYARSRARRAINDFRPVLDAVLTAADRERIARSAS